jgi:uncharacterized membrane protein YtjA (UPF0391 family)
MENRNLVLADALTFGLIAFVAALFGFSGLSQNVALIGKIVCAVSIVLVALSLVVKRPSARKG